LREQVAKGLNAGLLAFLSLAYVNAGARLRSEEGGFDDEVRVIALSWSRLKAALRDKIKTSDLRATLRYVLVRYPKASIIFTPIVMDHTMCCTIQKDDHTVTFLTAEGSSYGLQFGEASMQCVNITLPPVVAAGEATMIKSLLATRPPFCPHWTFTTCVEIESREEYQFFLQARFFVADEDPILVATFVVMTKTAPNRWETIEQGRGTGYIRLRRRGTQEVEGVVTSATYDVTVSNSRNPSQEEEERFGSAVVEKGPLYPVPTASLR